MAKIHDQRFSSLILMWLTLKIVFTIRVYSPRKENLLILNFRCCRAENDFLLCQHGIHLLFHEYNPMFEWASNVATAIVKTAVWLAIPPTVWRSTFFTRGVTFQPFRIRHTYKYFILSEVDGLWRQISNGDVGNFRIFFTFLKKLIESSIFSQVSCFSPSRILNIFFNVLDCGLNLETTVCTGSIVVCLFVS